MEKKDVEIKRFFSELSEENQKTLLNIGTDMTVANGTTLFYEGDEPNYVYLIRSGKVSLSKMTADGKEFSIHLKQKDELVGEVGLFNEMSISVTAIVVEEAELVRFERDRLEDLFRENGEIAVAFMKWFARHTQSTQAKFRDLLLSGKKGGFYSTLIRFSNSYGVEHAKGTLINVRLTNQDLASFISTSRESINRMLNELKRLDVVEMDNGFIIVKKIEFLKEYLDCGDCPIEICTI
ncbi:Crp/Fnr family transcriptional regulator [Desertibacillus haloalkaliphilus]|uniref:Crp/Fnr family transcriptional regulator n=1 Tax=Desertibacillus haloalkaliphilus TaxID=1328930 RepID=UPI001C263319|nr:Crp/Fnr family transcriptional regulator [Desertibacillus haloalkaliphilus]MBU8908317.1 Crp/Fnr family transcriptional regulator [Desertibacillus haloalkaliphilus]